MHLATTALIIASLAGTCCAQDSDVGVVDRDDVGTFQGTINGRNTILDVLDYWDASKLDGYELVIPSKHIILVDGKRLRDGTWSLVEYDGPEKKLGTLACHASATELRCTEQSGAIATLKRLDAHDSPIGQVKTESEEFAQHAFDAARKRRFREATYYLKLYRVTNVNSPGTQDWEALFEAEENNTVAAFYDDAMACKNAFNCRLRREPLAFIEAERNETEKAQDHYRTECRGNSPSHTLPPPFTCLMYAALNEQLGNKREMWRGYDFACVQLSFACGRAFGAPELQLISDIAQKRVAIAQAELLNTGLNVNARRGEALLKAVSIRSMDLVRALLERGADPNLGTGQALREAAYLDDFEILRVLLDHGADPNLQLTQSTLEIAVGKNNVAAVKALIDKGAAVNYNDAVNVGTALMDAVEDNNRIMVKILLDAGADPTIEAKFHDPVPISAKDPEIKSLITQALLACKSGRRVCADQKNDQ